MKNIQYIHRRPSSKTTAGPASHGGYTIAYRETDKNCIEYNVAMCSTRDNFNKKLGREIAAGRLIDNKYNAVVNLTVEEFRHIMYTIDYDLAYNRM